MQGEEHTKRSRSKEYHFSSIRNVSKASIHCTLMMHVEWPRTQEIILSKTISNRKVIIEARLSQCAPDRFSVGSRLTV